MTAHPGFEPSSPEPIAVRQHLYVFDPELRADRRLVRLLRSDLPAAVVLGAQAPAPRSRVSGPSVVLPVMGVMAAAIAVAISQVGLAVGAVVLTVAALCVVTAIEATTDAPHEQWAAVHAALQWTRRLAPGPETDEAIAAGVRLRAAAVGLPPELAAGVAYRRNALLWSLVPGIRSMRRLREALEPLRAAEAKVRAKADRVTAEAERIARTMRESTPWGDVEARVAAVMAERDRSPHVVGLRKAAADVATTEEQLATQTATVAVLFQELDDLVAAAAAATAGERGAADALAAMLARPVAGRTAPDALPAAPPPPQPSGPSTGSTDAGVPTDGAVPAAAGTDGAGAEGTPTVDAAASPSAPTG